MPPIEIKDGSQLDQVVTDPGEHLVGQALLQAMQEFPDREFQLLFQPGTFSDNKGHVSRPDWALLECNHPEPTQLVVEATVSGKLDDKKDQRRAMQPWLAEDSSRAYLQISSQLGLPTAVDLLVATLEAPDEYQAVQQDIYSMLQ